MTSVVTIAIDAIIDGIAVDVQQAKIVLAINEIPEIALYLAPVKQDEQNRQNRQNRQDTQGSNKNVSNSSPVVIKPDLEYYIGLYRELYSKANGLNIKGAVSIKLTRKDDDGQTNTQDIELKDWIVSGAAMSSVATEEAPYLVVTLQHPVCRLTKVGAVYGVPRSLLDPCILRAASEGNSLLDVIDKVYSLVRGDTWKADSSKKTEIFFTNDTEDKLYEFRKSLGDGIYNPNEYFVEKPQGILFLDGCIEDSTQYAKRRIAGAIGSLVLPYEGDSSTWQQIRSLCDDLLLSITQDQEDNFIKGKLVIGPSKPWRSSTITLQDYDCMSTGTPGTDPFKLSGVLIQKYGPLQPIQYHDFGNGTPESKGYLGGTLYIPEGINPDVSSGRIFSAPMPPVISQAIVNDAPSGIDIVHADINLLKTRLASFSRPLLDYCQALYENLVNSMVQTQSHMRLMFCDRDNNLILPGNTCVFKSNEKELFYGYIQRVEHFMSTKAICYTDINMTHSRPGKLPYITKTANGKSEEIELVKDGDVNPVYRHNV